MHRIAILFAMALMLFSQTAWAAPVSTGQNNFKIVGGNLMFQALRSPYGTITSVTATTPTANRLYTIPDVGVDASFLLNSGTQTMVGPLTLTGANVISHANTGMTIYNPAGTFRVTLAPSAEVANRTLTIPLLGAADTIATLGLAQTFLGVNTFSANPVLPLTGWTHCGSRWSLSTIQTSVFWVPLAWICDTSTWET